MFIKSDTISLRFNNILLTLKDINLISKNSIIETYEKHLLCTPSHGTFNFLLFRESFCADNANTTGFAL